MDKNKKIKKIPEYPAEKISEKSNLLTRGLQELGLSTKEITPKTQTACNLVDKLSGEGYSNEDISRMITDLYNNNPEAEGEFTQEQIIKVKNNYSPKTEILYLLNLIHELRYGGGYSNDDIERMIIDLFHNNPEVKKGDEYTQEQITKVKDNYSPDKLLKEIKDSVTIINDSKKGGYEDNVIKSILNNLYKKQRNEHFK